MTTATVLPRLEIDAASGKVQGKTAGGISYSHPFPVPNGTPGGSGRMLGVVMHTEVGYDPTVIRMFEAQGGHASAWFSISGTGHLEQYGPVGKGWMAWAQVDGNPTYYSIEHEDKGHPEVPLNSLQIGTSAQVVEVLSRFAGFPLQLADHPGQQGYGVHYMGGAAWGGHTCPDLVPGHGPRSKQRGAILELAHQIRAGATVTRHTGDGSQTWGELAHERGVSVEHLFQQDSAHYTVADYQAIAALPVQAGWPYYVRP